MAWGTGSPMPDPPMPDSGHWHRRGPGPGFRPPWWPENEPFPPVGPGAWRGISRRRFLRRAFLGVGLLFALMFVANAVAFALFPHAFGGRQHWRAGGAIWF